MLDEAGEEIELSDVFEDDTPAYATLDASSGNEATELAPAEEGEDDFADDFDGDDSELEDFEEEYSYDDGSDDGDDYGIDEE